MSETKIANMNTVATINAGLQAIISKLQVEHEQINIKYTAAIKNGEKYERIKSLYLSLKDVDVKLRDLMRSNITIA